MSTSDAHGQMCALSRGAFLGARKLLDPGELKDPGTSPVGSGTGRAIDEPRWVLTSTEGSELLGDVFHAKNDTKTLCFTVISCKILSKIEVLSYFLINFVRSKPIPI